MAQIRWPVKEPDPEPLIHWPDPVMEDLSDRANHPLFELYRSARRSNNGRVLVSYQLIDQIINAVDAYARGASSYGAQRQREITRGFFNAVFPE